MHSNRTIHTVDPPYAPPVLRPASPANSLSTDYGEDVTPVSDWQLSDAEFAAKVDQLNGLIGSRPDPDQQILLPKPRHPSEEAGKRRAPPLL